jgi:hypothetical protein
VSVASACYGLLCNCCVLLGNTKISACEQVLFVSSDGVPTNNWRAVVPACKIRCTCTLVITVSWADHARSRPYIMTVRKDADLLVVQCLLVVLTPRQL